MIVKDLDPFSSSSKMHLAGRNAEEQMAFYLRRAFEGDKQVRVMNSVRLESKGDAAQIDHLIFHRYGFILVESKSVTGKVAVNDHGEWVRVYGPKQTGMPSPILQAERQAAFLKRYLERHTESLLEKRLGLQTTFTAMAVDCLVAISDQGIIQRPKQLELPEVFKADQVAAQAGELIKGYHRANGLFSLSLNNTGRAFSDAEMARITAFLRAHHRPLGAVEEVLAEPSAVIPEVAQESNVITLEPTPYKCRHCQSEQLTIIYGKYGYYFNCASCEGNTPIKETCPGCRQKARVRKERERFFAECKDCERSTLFFQNAA